MKRVTRRYRRVQRQLRPYRSTIGLVLVVLVLSLAWVGVRGFLAARELRGVERDLVSLQQAASDPRSTSLDTLTADVQKRAGRADSLTHDVVWKAWSHAPLIGRPMIVVSGVSAEADRLSRGPLPPLVAAAKSVRDLRRPDGSFDVGPLAAQAIDLRRAAQQLTGSLTRVRALPSTRVPQLNDARATLAEKLDELTRRAQALAAGAAAAPELLGLNGPRRYLIAVQNLAEGRASGGIVGAYGLLRVDHGKPVLEAFGSDTTLQQLTTNALDFGAEWRDRYDPLGQARDWREVTATPDFPTAAKTMLALWAKTHAGEKLAGVVSIDPVALADVLQATGPIRSGARTLTPGTFVQASLVDAYRLFPDKRRRSGVLADNAKAVFAALVHGAGAPLTLGERLGNAIVGGHFKVYAANPAAQAQLATTSIAGALPTKGPLLAVFTQDGNNDKLFTYLRQSVSYEVLPGPQYLDFGDGTGPQRQELGRVIITLRNEAPAGGLPDYVAPATNLATGAAIPRGQMRISLSVYLGRLGLLDSAALDGHSAPMASQTEQGLSVLTLALDLPPGRTRTVELAVRQPAAAGAVLHVINQPTALPGTFFIGKRDVSPPFTLN